MLGKQRPWADFEAAAPELAASCRERIEAFRFVLVGTIRRDGTPRISPVEAHFAEGNLMLVMQAGTLKARDLLRDPRLVINTPVVNPDDPGAELKLRGRAVVVSDSGLLQATSDAIQLASGWRAPPDWHFFSIDLEDAAYMEWVEGALRMTRWTREGGIEQMSRDAPDL